jgi:hypothetical protein
MKKYLIPAAIVAILAVALIATPILAGNAKTSSGCCADQANLASSAPTCTTTCLAVSGADITCTGTFCTIAVCDPNVPCAIPGCPAVAAAVKDAAPACGMTVCPMASSVRSVNQGATESSPADVPNCPMMPSTPAGAAACPAMAASGCSMMK